MGADTATDLTIVVPLGNENEAPDCPHDHPPTTTMRTSESEDLLAVEDLLGQEDLTSTLTFLPITETIQVDAGTIDHHEMIVHRPGTTVDAAIAERIAALTETVAP
jgi:hypothetical protein